MAFSQTHFRSISLPSRIHPINSTNLEFNLQKLKSCDPKALPISSEAIQTSLLGLAELYNSVDELIQSSSTKQSLTLQKPQEGNLLEESLDGSIELLDSCNIIRELCQMIKENVQSLQSAIRRKGLDSNIRNDIASYLLIRKKMNKIIAKSLKKLKHFENRFGSSLVEADILKEVMGVNISIFKNIFLFFSIAESKSIGWSLVSKMMLTKSLASNDVVNEVGSVDFALISLQGRIRSNDGSKINLDLQMVQKGLQNLENCIEEFEEGLERLIRQLLRSRVTLLNIVTNN